MTTTLSKQGGRRYGQMRNTASGMVTWLRGVGTSATASSVTATVFALVARVSNVFGLSAATSTPVGLTAAVSNTWTLKGSD